MLKNRLFLSFLVSSLVAFFSSISFAQSESEQQEETFNTSPKELTGRIGDVPVYSHIYGADFMTEQERCNYLLKLDSMKTKEEREAFRKQHHEKIDMLRKEKGG
ncbi:hypothetical protein [Methylobacter sp. YRD-M1]|uniref:hypothetical protein n=1 Tax=Methylobacter sp. YRD-M1 TaxID=2911520 RepID=UPI00227C7D5E|nr:hypothetical protein [Methylobacter sp. YRD-M1]WAK00683.1 hypothetical protein LZ558_12590 [Methylobacter sp. YRD-M1]